MSTGMRLGGRSIRPIKVANLARVEGEGGLYVRVRGERVEEVRLNIFEPPRFFEAFLNGRRFDEAPDITARICGICPIAYQMSSSQAMEEILGVRVEGQLRALRRLVYCGEWVESHTLHIFLLHAPDFLGYQSAMEMAREHREIVEKGLYLKRMGNELVRLIGGREIHPVNLKVGGFYKAPSRKTLLDSLDGLKRARDMAVELVRWAMTLPFPRFERDYEFVALSHPDEYPMDRGRLVSNRGLDIPIREYEKHFIEEQVPHSTALHSRIKGRGHYLVGPLARFNLNFDRLSPLARETAREVGLLPPCRNPFMSIVVRAVEVLHAFDEAVGIIEGYEEPERASADLEVRAGTGCGCTEAPRGILYHRYTIDEKGIIQEAKIVPPTSQNQGMIEEDLKGFIEANLHLPEEELLLRSEQVVRNYDPCISCATHSLEIRLERV